MNSDRNSKAGKKSNSMLFSLEIAWRYLFSKKSHNAINIISGISSFGVAVGAMALVVVLSVFNGFESLVSSMFSAFDPDLRIEIAEGKIFDVSDTAFQKVKSLNEVEVFTEVIQENALLRFKDKQMPAVVKGVADNFGELTHINNIMYDGKFELFDGAFERAVPGIGVASKLGLGAHFIDPLNIYAPKRTSRINLLRPESSFNQSGTFVSGIFTVNQLQYDDQYVLVSISLARELFEYDSTMVSFVELKIKPTANPAKVQKAIADILGDNYRVKNRYEQQENFFKIMQIEKWITFLILSFILLIAVFNIIGSLSMLIIEKKPDISTLRSLGADESLIKRIFLLEGWFISLVGAVAGIFLGTVISLIQQHFGLLKLGKGYIVEAYPVVTSYTDILLVFITVLIMGMLAVLYPVKYISKSL